ncbi:hypothetical protein N0M98_08105 [Paenibacillus doosanensis]|uniref:Hydrolase n=1 Tax=Paenibacillus konkukensis TaxID=2020716 RepID=A0ABY4RKS4_9BACL|nr:MULTISPECIES: hypothetical protein [Paenibacillus]MCS7460101.1 hypothetical protein [Paenibacillus doosanensis]UQZ82755.1 hypothetical protein SK3146_01915 [Paenibacillus konkukensis]
MEKKTYYIAVASSEILEPENMTGNFEFEISATEEEIEQLREMFEDSEDAHDDTAARAMIPVREYHFDKENDAADYYLREIYRKIHELGTPATREHIESMNVLQ